MAEDDFNNFWAIYPRKVAKPAAVKAWPKAIKKMSAERIIEILRRHVTWWQANGIEKKYIPHPASWLNGERWSDELDDGPTPARRSANVIAADFLQGK